MSKYKILLTGGYVTAIDDLFAQSGDVFECMTTSPRLADLMAHLKYFEPELFLYCMSEEHEDTLKNVAGFAASLKKQNVAIAVYGTEAELSSFKALLKEDPELSFMRPKSMAVIKDGITQYLDDMKVGRLDDRTIASISGSGRRSAPVPPPAPSPAPAAAAPATPSEGSDKKHILVIDDDPMMLKLIREYLKADYQVATAINGRTAHKFLETRSTDLILLDYEMPGDNGPVVLKQLRENPATASIPVIFLTGITERDKIQEALAQKPQGYMLKPIDHDKLMVAVKKFL